MGAPREKGVDTQGERRVGTQENRDREPRRKGMGTPQEKGVETQGERGVETQEIGTGNPGK